MKLQCASRPTNDTTAEAARWVVDLADDGDWAAAMTAARAQVFEGHVLLHVQRIDE